MRHVPVWFLLSLAAAAGATGCKDPNPTFNFDAAPVVRDAGAAGTGGAVAEAGAPEGGAGNDAGDAR